MAMGVGEPIQSANVEAMGGDERRLNGSNGQCMEAEGGQSGEVEVISMTLSRGGYNEQR